MSALSQLTSRTTPVNRRQILALAFGAFVIVFVLWQFAGSTIVLYPFRLFVTQVHELGHGLTAIISGGDFIKYQVEANGSGVATYRNGNPLLVLPMGYLGAALFGAALLFAANRIERVNWLAAGLGIWFAGCAIWFTGTGKLSLFASVLGAVGMWLLSNKTERWKVPLRVGSALAIVATVLIVQSQLALLIGVITGALLIVLGTFASRPVIIAVLNFLAMITGFNAVSDVWSLMGNQTASVGATANDALAMANYTHTPVEVWIVLWTALAILMMGCAAYFALLRPVQTRQD